MAQLSIMIYEFTFIPTSYSARYTFSGKERDEESGFSYFGARYYNSAYSIWMSIDPMSDKYPSLSPYAYCGNNPIKLVDPNGETPRIYCETKGVGHAFITTGEGKNTVVYTYGRYLGGGKGKSSANSLDPSGKGVLLRLEGKEAQRYIKHELKDNDAKCFEITDASDDKVDSYFNTLSASGKKLNSEEANYYDSNPNNYGTSDNARVIDKYDLLTNNCVSKTIAGAKAGGSKNKFLQKRYYISTVSSIPVEYSVQPKSPKHLQQYLQNCSKQKGSIIKEVTDIINSQF